MIIFKNKYIFIILDEPLCPQDSSPDDIATFFPVENNCTEFYECDNGVATLFACPAGLYFNPDPAVNVCDFAKNVDCKNP